MVLGAVFKVDYGILKCFEQIRSFFLVLCLANTGITYG